MDISGRYTCNDWGSISFYSFEDAAKKIRFCSLLWTDQSCPEQIQNEIKMSAAKSNLVLVFNFTNPSGGAVRTPGREI